MLFKSEYLWDRNHKVWFDNELNTKMFQAVYNGGDSLFLLWNVSEYIGIENRREFKGSIHNFFSQFLSVHIDSQTEGGWFNNIEQRYPDCLLVCQAINLAFISMYPGPIGLR